MSEKKENILIEEACKKLEESNNRQLRELKLLTDNIYAQTESFLWLQRRLSIKRQLPPLRGWPVSPDFLLRLHTWIMKSRPNVIVEMGSGATTVVIADALRQNDFGKLYSFEHLQRYADSTRDMLNGETLDEWVDLRVGDLQPWVGAHMNSDNAEKPSRWYSFDLDGVEKVELLIVDGPPAGTCHYARYPAVPAVFEHFAPHAEIWMDDANRQDEKKICKRWAEEYALELEFFPLEKGLGVLRKR